MDSSGNVMVTGQFSGSIDFGEGSFHSGAVAGIFVVKYSVSGTYLWSEGFTNGAGTGIAADSAGNTIVTGYFNGTTDFGGSVLTGAWNDIFLLKLAP